MGVVVFKYAPNGDEAWATPARWDPSVSDPDAGPFDVDTLAPDGAGNVYVAGDSTYGGRENAVILKASGADGQEQPEWVYEPRRGTESHFEGLVVRGSSIVVAGTTWSDADGSEFGLVVGSRTSRPVTPSTGSASNETTSPSSTVPWAGRSGSGPGPAAARAATCRTPS